MNTDTKLKYNILCERIKNLQNNNKDLSMQARLMILIALVSHHPDSPSIMSSWDIIDPDRMKMLMNNGCGGYLIGLDILNHIDISTASSKELSLRYNGYIKPITEHDIDILIDKVAARLEMQKSYFKQHNYMMNQERLKQEEMALNDLSEKMEL